MHTTLSVSTVCSRLPLVGVQVQRAACPREAQEAMGQLLERTYLAPPRLVLYCRRVCLSCARTRRWCLLLAVAASLSRCPRLQPFF